MLSVSSWWSSRSWDLNKARFYPALVQRRARTELGRDWEFLDTFSQDWVEAKFETWGCCYNFGYSRDLQIFGTRLSWDDPNYKFRTCCSICRALDRVHRTPFPPALARTRLTQDFYAPSKRGKYMKTSLGMWCPVKWVLLDLVLW